MNHTKHLYLLILSLIYSGSIKAQDAEFTQFLNAPLYLNPAFTGVAIGPRFMINYRNEWPALDKAFISYHVSFDQDIDKINGGVGLSAFNDVQANGLYSQLQFTGSYAYQFKMDNETAVRIGLSASYSQIKIDFNKLIFGDMIDPGTVTVSIPTGELVPSTLTKSYSDFGAGFLLYSKKLFIGGGVKHITQPALSFYSTDDGHLPVRFAFHFGYEFKKNRRSKSFFTPNAMYAMQGRFHQLNVGVMSGRGVLIGGLNYRHDFSNPDAFIFILGIKKGVFKAAYSYDETSSDLKSKTGGAHEISISINLADQKNAEKIRRLKRYTECPSIL